MNIKEEKNCSNAYTKVCIALIWLTVFYSSIIQHKVIQIPNGMILLGLSILGSYYLAHCNSLYNYYSIFTPEIKCLFVFMIYMLISGSLFSPNVKSHVNQWITSAEYMFLLMIITSLIQETETDTFHVLLLIRSIVLVFVFLYNPVYYGGHRYSISLEMNPNSLGMAFATGAWVVLYQQQRRKISLLVSLLMIAVFTYCIFITGSRKSLIAIGLSVLLWFALCFLPSLKQKSNLKGITTFCIFILMIVALGWFFSFIYSDSVIATRMGNLLHETQEGNRSDMYRTGLKLFKMNPLFGLGFQGFSYYYGLYSHATIVEIPVSGGIIGTILYFSAYIISIKKTIHVYRATKGNAEFTKEHLRATMIIIIWVVMLFYTSCIIHPYILDSFLVFGIIFGDVSYIEKKIHSYGTIQNSTMKIGSRYIR